MKTFIDWAKDNEILGNIFPLTDLNPEETWDENTKRTGYSHNYPPGYVMGQYPPGYFMPIKATALIDAANKPAKARFSMPD